MKDLLLEADAYASEKTNEVITKAIAQAYVDGYRNGYEDCKATIPVDLQKDSTEYVDLGLPSGTLWATDYVKENGKVLYLPYCKAEQYQIPTKEQWMELRCKCKYEYKQCEFGSLINITFIGQNGNTLVLNSVGRITADGVEYDDSIYMWLKNIRGEDITEAVQIYNLAVRNPIRVMECFSGYKLPIRLVKQS